jgi:hypothetical protein
MKTLAKIEAKTLAALHPFTAVKDVRYYLDGVLIEPDPVGGAVAVATNGHVMLVVNDFEGECEAPVIVQFESTLATQMKKKDAGIATISRIAPDSPQLQISLANGFAGPAQLVDGKYPDYKAVMPAELAREPRAQVHYGSNLLAAFCTAEKVLRSHSKARGISIVNGAEKACGCVLFPHISDTLHARGVIMPLMQKALGRYSWAPVREEPTSVKLAA